MDPAARGEYGFVVNSNYTNMAGSNIFLRKPVEAMIDDSRIGNREAILQASIRDQNILKKGIARFKKGADKVAIECRNKFQRLSRMKPIFWKHTDGAEFVNMKNSLDRLQQIQNGNISVDDLKQRLSDLKRDAHNYNVSHRGFFKANPGYGANRFEMSEELERYADQCLKNMLTAPKNMLSVPKEMVSYETTAEQITLLESNVEKLQAELAKENPEARAQARNALRNGGNRIGLEGLGNRVNNGHNANNNNVDYHALRNQNRENAANNMQLNVINNENEPIIKVAGE